MHPPRGAHARLSSPGCRASGSGFDTNWTYELGVKSGGDDSPVAGSATAFLVNWNDMQSAGANAARVTGIELEADANPSRWLTLHALYAYTNARFRAGTLDLGGSDIGGNRLPYAPLQAASLRATLHGSLLQQWQWSFDAGVDLVGSEYAGWDNLNWFESRQVWNFRCALAGERWEAALWARNLGVRRYSSFATFDSVDTLDGGRSCQRGLLGSGAGVPLQVKVPEPFMRHRPSCVAPQGIWDFSVPSSSSKSPRRSRKAWSTP